MTKKKELKMAKIDVSQLAIRVIINTHWYTVPKKNIPFDVEGTVLTITTTRKRSTKLLKMGEYIELILNEAYNNSCTLRIRWDNDTKATVPASSVIIRSAKMSFCMTIWDNYLPLIDKRPYHKLMPSYYKPATLPRFITVDTNKLKTDYDYHDEVNIKIPNVKYYTAVVANSYNVAIPSTEPYETDVENASAIKTISTNKCYSSPKQKTTEYKKYFYPESTSKLWRKIDDDTEQEMLKVLDKTPLSAYPKLKKRKKSTTTLHQMNANTHLSAIKKPVS